VIGSALSTLCARALQAVAFDIRDGVITISDADVVLAQG